MTAALAALVGVCVGASIGSYAAVVGVRGWRASVGGRSRCDHCLRELRWFEEIPLLSYVALRGRCRTCGSPIGRALVIAEAAGALLGGGLIVLMVAAARL